MSASTLRHAVQGFAQFAKFAEQNPMLAVGVIVITAIGVYVLARVLGDPQTAAKRRGPATTLTEDFKPLQLKEKIIVSHDTRIFRFALPSPAHILGLPIGQHMYLKASVGGSEVQRAYTPISSDDDHGHVDLMVKVYFPNVHPKFPEGGKMSQHLESLKPGDSILVKGPVGRFTYLGQGRYRVKQGAGFKELTTKKLGLVAGGTGITPMLQIIRAVLKDPADRTQMWLLFANQTEQDILLRNELEECAKDPRLKLWYTLDRPEAEWKYSKGFVDFDMVSEHLPSPDGSDTVVLMCGPGPMITHACKPNLVKRSFTDEQLFAF